MISEKVRTVQGMEGAPRRATGVSCTGTALGAPSRPSLPVNPPDPEVLEKAVRRRFTAEYKLSILCQAKVYEESGGVGALLCRGGLYSSHLTSGGPPEGCRDHFRFKAEANNGGVKPSSPRPEFPGASGGPGCAPLGAFRR